MGLLKRTYCATLETKYGLASTAKRDGSAAHTSSAHVYIEGFEMSSLVYGIVTAKRVVAPKDKSKTTSAPGMGTYLDALTALVPAEALALYAGILIPYATHTSAGGKKITAISNPGLLAGGATAVTILTSGSDTELTVKSPRGAALGPVDVTVTAPTGVSAATEQDHYTYTASEE
jgi:hypothetical protein